MESDKYWKELNVAVRIVHLACSLCEKVQKQLVSSSEDQVKRKDDDTLVTIADYSVQATVSWMLSNSLGNVSIVAEEDILSLSKPESSTLLTTVVQSVNDCLADAPRFGLQPPEKPLTAPQILEAINRCSSTGGPMGRHWILDPVDGTLGFVRGDQYAVALALIDHGKVVLGVLGCPNYPVREDGLNKYSQGNLIGKKNLTSSQELGCVMYASKGSGKSWMQPLLCSEQRFEWPHGAKTIRVSSIDSPEMATFCEPVEKTNSNHTFTAGVANSVGLRKKPLRVYSMVKYAAIARGEAEIYMKFASLGYKEKIWDHAAGILLVEEAGGVVTDAGGRSIDFSRGIYLEGLDRGIVACSGIKLHEKIIGAVYASWESSNL